MIKGHAVVELRDAATGEVQRIEHDNMITNGLRYCLTPWLGKFSFASLGSSPQVMTDENTQNRKNNNKSIMNHLLGGIFLFQNNLAEDADNVAFPLDNPLTGKASWDAYNGMDTCRGSYNENESGLQEDGSYRHVWEFSTSQANGQISALALTTYKGGICGDGFREWDSETESAITEAPFFELGQIKIKNPGNVAECAPFIRASSNEIYYREDDYNLRYSQGLSDRHLSNTGKLFMKKKKYPLSRISPFYDYYNQYLSEDIGIDVPEEFAVYAAQSTCYEKTSDSYLYIWKQKSMAPKEQFRLLRIRKSDLETKVITLTNSTPYTLNFQRVTTCFTDEYCITNGYKYENGEYEYKIFRINLTDNEVADIPVDGAINLRKIGEYIYINENTNKNVRVINPKTFEIRPHPDFEISNTYHSYLSTESITPNIFLEFIKTNNSSSYIFARICISANTLMTINNLPSPVIKTAAQTMKITYTIQETEG